jgi:hypothetical protein
MLTACDFLADAVNICTELSRVLETIHLSGIFITPAVLEAAAGASRAGVGETSVRVGEAGSPGSPCILDSAWYWSVSNTQHVLTHEPMQIHTCKCAHAQIHMHIFYHTSFR